ncbi:MAG TPA: bifunctional oligoribonuclease/PAP phosphatase NrnA [Patescibacteria group bacterium]|nr:bifunctional oligoribonuclease/PAP phosphatase NrnA [Patescibacteria group bacterium]
MAVRKVSLSEAADLLKQARSVALTTHMRPDGDAIGSMLGLYHHLQATGKQVAMLLDDEVPPMYRFLPAWEKIARPGERQAYDLLVILDASDAERVGTVSDAVDAPVLNLDHHISNAGFADYSYVDSAAAATGEIVLDLLLLAEAPGSPALASCLYTAIATDCGFFRYANTAAATFRHAARLVEWGAQPELVAEAMDVRPLASVQALGRVLETLELYANNRIACISLTEDLLNEVREYTDGLVNYPRTIEGVDVAILFKVAENSQVRVSLRSRGFDVSRLALTFGGGGHVRAAGCTVKGSLAEAKEQVITMLTRQLEETA